VLTLLEFLFVLFNCLKPNLEKSFKLNGSMEELFRHGSG
jgi:hypothetical protein